MSETPPQPHVQNGTRDFIDKTVSYEKCLRLWQEKINLISDSTLEDIQNRHFRDSEQLVSAIKSVNLLNQNGYHVPHLDASLMDLGSGAGFPGMILAISGFKNVHLVESDQRKCAFLRDVARTTGVRPTIHNQRVEKLAIKADIITSRAFADLAKTLEISYHLCHENTQYFLLKPLDMEKELTEATKYWYFCHEMIPSVTDPRGCVLRLSQIRKK